MTIRSIDSLKRYLRQFFHLPPAVKWLLATEILYGFGFALWNLNYNFHLSARRFSVPEIGAVNGFGLVIIAVFSLWAGKWCDHHGFRPAMVFGCLARACGIIAVAVVPGHASVYGGQLLFSIGTAFILASEFPLLLSLITPDFNHIAYNLLYCAAYGGIFVGYVSGGLLPIPVTGTVTKYALPLLFSGLTYLLIGIGRQFLPSPKRIPTSPRIFVQILFEPKVIWFSFYGVLGSLGVYVVSSMVNLICRDTFHLADDIIGIVYTLPTVASGVASFIVPLLINRSWRIPSVGLIGLCLSALTLLGMAAAHYPLFVVLWVLFSFFNMLLPGAVDNPMLQAIDEAERGSYSGIRICANNIGNGIGACLSGLILGYGDYSLNMLAGAGVVLIQVGVYWFGCRKYLRFSENENCYLT